jgi:hypothetical protein
LTCELRIAATLVLAACLLASCASEESANSVAEVSGARCIVNADAVCQRDWNKYRAETPLIIQLSMGHMLDDSIWWPVSLQLPSGSKIAINCVSVSADIASQTGHVEPPGQIMTTSDIRYLRSQGLCYGRDAETNRLGSMPTAAR